MRAHRYPYICSEVLSSDIWSITDSALSNSDELLVPFWNAILSRDTVPVQPTATQHQHPLFSHISNPSPPGSPRQRPLSDARTQEDQVAESSSTGVLGLDVKSSSEEATVTTARENGPGISVLAGYWAKVNGVLLDKKPREMIDFVRSLPQIVELFVAHMEIPAVVDLLYRIIQCEEAVPDIGVIDWLSNRDLIARLVDLLSPSHSGDLHNTVSELLKAIIALSAPSPASLTQSSGAEAFGFGGPESMPSQDNGNVGGVNNRLVRELASEEIVRKMISFMLDASLPTRLQRRLSEAAEEINADSDDLDIDFSKKARSRPSALASSRSTLSKLSENPRDKSGQSSSDESALEDEELESDATPSRRRRPLNPRDTPATERSNSLLGGAFDHRDSTATIRPTSQSLTPIRAPQVEVSPESCTSTLVTCIGVLIELIRKNNSDYFEQYLFHTLRSHLLQRQQEIAERKANKTAEEVGGEAKSTTEEGDKTAQIPADEEDDDEMEGMEEAMAEMSDKLGIVHLGPMLRVLSERLSDFQELITRSRMSDQKTVNSIGKTPALTFERYRITELYAELLHCSNMALLNRSKDEGPQYSDDGVLLGGIEGLQTLARTLQGGDASSDSGEDHSPPGLEQGSASGVAKQEDEATTKQDVGSSDETQERSQDRQSPDGSKGDAPVPAAGERRHSRQATTAGGAGGNGSEDTDDEALLSEVSLDESQSGAGASATDADSSAPIDIAGAKQPEETSSKQLSGVGGEEDDEIRSVLSNLSLADLTTPSPHPSQPPSPLDEGRENVIGDLLKRKFLDCNVVPTVLTLFFEYPWNNFLHNVVYDILQQFFNGRMESGLNRRLTLAVFEGGRLTEKIVEGHKINEESLQGPRKIRMGYMGHMNLIAEETVKLLERYPREIGAHVTQLLTPEWRHFVEESLKEVREREAAPLAGGRPQMMQTMSFSQHGAGSGAASGAGEGQDYGRSQAIGSDAFASYLSSQMSGGNASSDDDDSDEDASWLSQDARHRNAGESSADGFDDAFEPSHSGVRQDFGGGGSGGEDDDDEWGPFADSSENRDASHRSSASAYLTPADWAADFHRETSASEGASGTRADDEHADDDSSSTASTGDGDTAESGRRERSNSGGSDSNNTPFIDLLDCTSLRQTDAVAAAHARRPSLGQHESLAGTSSSPTEPLHRRSSSSSGSSEPTLAHATDSDEPLGPGVAPDAQADKETGLIERVIDGEKVKVPLDDVALAAQTQAESAEQQDDTSKATGSESSVEDAD